MSKKKQTSPVPMTGVVTITTDGRNTFASRLRHTSEDTAVLDTATAACCPGDTYCEYEGARIALARLYGVGPFPQGNDDAPQETGHWEAATKENCKVGSRVRVVNARVTYGHYDNGDIGAVDRFFKPDMAFIRFDGEEKITDPVCFLNELEVWIPGVESPADGKTLEQSEKKPFRPSFQVGDIVRLSENGIIFSFSVRGRCGKVIGRHPFATCDMCAYQVRVITEGGRSVIQSCLETPDSPAPLELLYRDPEKGGEKA